MTKKHSHKHFPLINAATIAGGQSEMIVGRGYEMVPFLPQPSIDAWLPEKHLARFVLEIIYQFDLSGQEQKLLRLGFGELRSAGFVSTDIRNCPSIDYTDGPKS
jgi:hypothetical protein